MEQGGITVIHKVDQSRRPQSGISTVCVACRVQRVGVFNFGSDRVRVLEKTSGSGSGMDWVRVLAPNFLSIGYYRVLKFLIGYFPILSYLTL